MTSADLAREAWEAIARVRNSHLDKLEALGCPRASLAAVAADMPALGVGRVAFGRDGLFQPSEEGEGAFVQPVNVADGIGPVVVDLIAWKPADPSRWWWRVGCGDLLGEYWLGDEYPVPVVTTPLDWLAASGEAVCILDWDLASPVWQRLRHGPGLSFTDDATRTRVRNALIQSAPLPILELQNAG